MYLYRSKLTLGFDDDDADLERANYLRFVRSKFLATDILANFGTPPIGGAPLPDTVMLLHASADFRDKWDTLRCRRGEAGQPPAPVDAGIAVHRRFTPGRAARRVPPGGAGREV